MTGINVDGYFEIKEENKEIFLKVCAPEGEGKSVSIEEVMDAFEQRGYSDVDYFEITYSVSSMKGEFRKIGSV